MKKLTHKLSRNMMRNWVNMACNSVVFNYKLLYNNNELDAELQTKLISNYKTYFDLDLTDDLREEAVEEMKDFIRSSDEQTKFLLYKCLKEWFL